MIADLPPNPAMHDWPLPYEQRLESRAEARIDLVVMHCTELPDLAMAREFGEREVHASGTGNSGHFYIDRDGTVHVFVQPQRIAHHTRGYNERSIGIELVNGGRYPDWLDTRHQAMEEPYTDAQIAALVVLINALRREIPTLEFIAGHEDLDRDTVPASNDPGQRVSRKRDPGPRFPWSRVLEQAPLARIRP